MARLSKRSVDAAENRASDHFLWDDELPNFGLRVYASGKRSFLLQYRAGGRTRRLTIGLHGVWTPETARKEARILLGRIAQGDNPAEERQLDHQAITVKELCERYLEDAEKGVVLGKKRRPKKASTLLTDRGRILRHIVPLLGSRRVKDITSADVTRFVRDIVSANRGPISRQGSMDEPSSAVELGLPRGPWVSWVAYSPTPGRSKSLIEIQSTAFVRRPIM